MHSAPIDPAKVMPPLRAALSPNPTCNIIGSRNGTAPTAIRDSDPLNTDSRKVAIRIRRKSKIGCACKRAWRQ